jgi:hypothetical protein
MSDTFWKSNYSNVVILMFELSCILKLSYFNYDNVKLLKNTFPNQQNYASKTWFSIWNQTLILAYNMSKQSSNNIKVRHMNFLVKW